MNDADSIDGGLTAATQARLGPAERVWQVNTRGRKVLEMSLAELAASVKAGKLSSKTLVWHDGMPGWTPLAEVPELSRIAHDSEPPTSGARFIGNEPASLAGLKSYVSTGSEPPTDPGTLAIYERPLAMIEFPDTMEVTPESVDEPTPAFGSSRENARTTLPGLAPEDLVPVPSSRPGTPPEPPRRAPGVFPSPVTSSPLGAALSSMARSNPSATPLPPGRSKPHHDVTSYAVAKATPIPSTEALQQALSAADEAAASTPRPHTLPAVNGALHKPSAPNAALTKPTAPNSAVTKPPAPNSAVTKPAAPNAAVTKPSAPNSAVHTPLGPNGAVHKPSAPNGAVQKPFAATVVSAEPPVPVVPSTRTAPTVDVAISTLKASAAASAVAPAKSPSSLVPRPALEFLPPIIVQEKEDDGASIITLPLDANFHESTLVLSGRRRPRRRVPLGAAIAAAAGAACVASALTALVVSSRAPATRIVEKRVLVPVVAPSVTAPEAAPPASTAAAPPERTKTPSNVEAPKAPASERVSSKAETSSPAAKAWRKDDPGALEQPASSVARRGQRAGFPTNPGF
jgi:hypothetical protein